MVTVKNDLNLSYWLCHIAIGCKIFFNFSFDRLVLERRKIKNTILKITVLKFTIKSLFIYLFIFNWLCQVIPFPATVDILDKMPKDAKSGKMVWNFKDFNDKVFLKDTKNVDWSIAIPSNTEKSFKKLVIVNNLLYNQALLKAI